MHYGMQLATMLGENIDGFIKLVYDIYENKREVFTLHPDKLYQLKLLVEEYKFQMLADEIIRINRFSWDEKYTLLLVARFKEGLNIIETYIESNYEDLYIFTARLFTLKNYCLAMEHSAVKEG